ncbi:MAG TPA: NAD(P)H-dependent oxidoreductase subunit E [Desulfuromonadaceae bacterium]
MTAAPPHHDDPAAGPFPEVDEALGRCGFCGDALIEVLHVAQERYGWLSRELLRYVASRLELPPSRVYGVASFYHFFTLEPKGRHRCTVCTGTSCHIKGGSALLRELERRFGIPRGTTGSDGAVTLETVRCLGLCGMAPLVLLDGTAIAGGSPGDVADEACRRLGISGRR